MRNDRRRGRQDSLPLVVWMWFAADGAENADNFHALIINVICEESEFNRLRRFHRLHRVHTGDIHCRRDAQM